MVSRKVKQRKAVRVQVPFWTKCVLILSVAVMSFTFIIKAMQFASSGWPVGDAEIEEPIEDEPEPELELEPIIEITAVDFQPTIDAWVSSVGGRKGVIIYDLERDTVVGQYNADQKFSTASLYKLFVVYEGYRRIQNGSLDPNTMAGVTGYNIQKCLDLAIRESHSPCAETIWKIIGRDDLNEIARNEFNIPDIIVSNLSATPSEIMQIMKRFYEHPDIQDEALLAGIWDSFLNQPITIYNWRQGLPSGFSDKVLVYNKVGWNWDGEKWTIYDDAAILDFVAEERHFIVVVMTSGVAYQQIRNLGAQIEEAFYNQNVLKN